MFEFLNCDCEDCYETREAIIEICTIILFLSVVIIGFAFYWTN